jgi:glutamine amidotransferase
VISSDKNVIAQASKIILPGVGAFDTGMTNLQKLDLTETLNRKITEEHTPVLGICLGMQLLAEKSEEGVLPGLGWIKGKVIRFSFSNTSEYKIPHMGWNHVNIKKESPLFAGMHQEPRFYFVHSYHFKPEDSGDILCTTEYGSDFISSVEHGNILGVQFHPEKSHKFGIKLLSNFVENY